MRKILGIMFGAILLSSVVFLGCQKEEPKPIPPTTIDGTWGHFWASGDVEIQTTLELKSNGDQLTGNFTEKTKKALLPYEIKEGKVKGNTVAFAIVETGRSGDTTYDFTGTFYREEDHGELMKLKKTERGGSGSDSGTEMLFRKQVR